MPVDALVGDGLGDAAEPAEFLVAVEAEEHESAGDGLGLQHQVFFVRWGGLPKFRPMRGDIDDLLSAA